MKRYLLFAGRNYYPQGGWSDLVGDFDEVPTIARRESELKRYNGGRRGVEITWTLADKVYDWWQIVDLAAGEVIKSGCEHSLYLREDGSTTDIWHEAHVFDPTYPS